MAAADDAQMVMPFLRAVAEGREVQYQRREAQPGQWQLLTNVEDMVGAILNGFIVRVAPRRKLKPLGRSELRQLISEHLVRHADKTMHVCNGVRVNEHGTWLVSLREVGLVNLREYTAEELLIEFALVDGTPCGVLTDEN